MFVFCLSFAWFFFFDYIFSLHENFTSVYWAFVFNLVLFDRCACVFAFIIVGFNLVGLSIMLKPCFVVISDFRKLVRELWIYKVLFSKRIFFFFFLKQYKNNFQKIEIGTSFQIIIFTLYLFVYHFKEKISKYCKKKMFGRPFLFKKKNYKKWLVKSIDYFLYIYI